MSDANAYMNAYVDNAVGMIHEYIGGILQLKTQLKVCESIIAAKNAELEKISGSKNEELEQILSSKESELNDLRNQLIGHGNLGTENIQLHQRCNDLQNENNALKQKVGHMDNLLRQVSKMKQDIITRNGMIAGLEQKIVDLQEMLVLKEEAATSIVTEPFVINKKKKIEKPSAQKEDDDF
jgi:predicted RNase H-like nuclease (RuvC/YqgF family)